ncbi:MAG: helix-turn-helix domain-containing protein [Deltaproteobacteria bacterium]|nr:helix-turn-helix domain-containing protein [Deltaproteobacteria bacterium]
MSIDQLWKVSDVATFLRVSRSTVYAKVAAGLIPHRRVVGQLRFVPDEIRSLVVRGA